MKPLAPLLLAVLAACSASMPSEQNEADPLAALASPAASPTPAPEPPPAPEAAVDKNSAQGAAQLVQTYFALIESGRYDQAWALWSDSGRASGMTADAFAASFGKYADYLAEIGAPGRIEGAAGSLYVDVPVVAHGRLTSGEPFRMEGPVTLRRCNDVPGCTAAQREWHIASTGLKRAPSG